jgi:hypothetical protein
MAYQDPLSITIDGTAHSLARTGFGPASGSFATGDGTVQITVSHAYGKRQRRLIKLTTSKVVSDPLVPDQNVRPSMSVHFVADTPANGYTVAEAKKIADGFVAFLAASTGANITKLLGGES